MNYKAIEELTDEFFRESMVIDTHTDTSRAVIPAPRSASQIIEDEVRYWSSIMTIQLRAELCEGIDKAKAELDAMRAEHEAVKVQRRMLSNECAAVAEARRMLDYEIRAARSERRDLSELYNRVCYATGLCTPSRNRITGR